MFFAQDLETAALLREATRWADMKDWDKAIACLKKADTRMLVSPVSYPILTWLKLPLYLQKAGRFDEAMSTCEQLIKSARWRVERGAPQAKPKAKEALLHHELGTIYDKMRLMCKREKQVERSAEYARLSEYHDSMHRKLFRPL